VSQENVEVVQAVYGSWAQGDFSASVPLFDPNVLLVIDPEIPEGGTYVGPDGVRKYMSRFLDSWESLTIAGESFEEVGDIIAVKVRQKGIGLGSQVPAELEYFQLWTFRGPKVVRLEVILREERALEVLGLQEGSSRWTSA
jgi:ketosteroid isomerase-like protein